MSGRETTLTGFIQREQRRFPDASGDFAALLNDIRLACERVSVLVGRGALGDMPGAAGTVNVHGTAQTKLEVAANDAFLRTRESGGHLAATTSDQMNEPGLVPGCRPRGRYLLAFEPLDGSPNVDLNVSVGSIFSVLRCPDGVATPDASAFLQPGTQQLCAGYALYGPSTMLVLTAGRGVHGFTLDRCSGEFILTHPDLAIAPAARELAANASDQRFWEPPVQRYVAECLAGRSGPRGADFDMRWIASPVAELHRLLIRGGLFMYPQDTRDASTPGRLRLVHEANPMAMLVEQAGGAASTGRGRLMAVQPESLRQRVAVILGSREEVARIEGYHREHDAGLDRPFESPLFRERSLFAGG